MRKRHFLGALAALVLVAGARAEDLPIHTNGIKHQDVVIRGAQVFNGCSPDLIKADVLVSGNLVKKIAPGLAAPAGAFEIDGSGHTLIPGLIDAHWHGVYAEASAGLLMGTGEGYWNLMAAKANRSALMRGYTTVRDAAGPVFDVARATNEGMIVGPRVFPSTCGNAGLLEMSGERNPYKDGSLGVIEEGAYADMILVEGNPLKDLNLVGDSVKNFDMIMKDGVIYKLDMKK